jgi:SEC-C motif
MSSRAGAGRPDRGQRLARLRADRELLAREHPYLDYRLDERQLTGVARGAVPMLLPDGRVDPLEIAVDFHPGYVPGAPTVYDSGRRWTPDSDRHIPPDHSFCMYLREVDEPDLRRPTALHVFMLDVVCFLEQQLIYDRIGRIPGPQWPHTRDAYALYIVEQLANEPADIAEHLWESIRGTQPSRNSPCPCTAGRKYKHCHLALVAELARIAGRHGFRGLDFADLRSLAGVAT